ncbi:MAG: 3-oxoacyl-[acyl-carrier protein] reductase, partial [uncultured Thermoleophilia bacterium]
DRSSPIHLLHHGRVLRHRTVAVPGRGGPWGQRRRRGPRRLPPLGARRRARRPGPHPRRRRARPSRRRGRRRRGGRDVRPHRRRPQQRRLRRLRRGRGGHRRAGARHLRHECLRRAERPASDAAGAARAARRAHPAGLVVLRPVGAPGRRAALRDEVRGRGADGRPGRRARAPRHQGHDGRAGRDRDAVREQLRAGRRQDRRLRPDGPRGGRGHGGAAALGLRRSRPGGRGRRRGGRRRAPAAAPGHRHERPRSHARGVAQPPGRAGGVAGDVRSRGRRARRRVL